jgi:late competence protein required for DNA uptake (superfamily II DNA/RNA helicase)
MKEVEESSRNNKAMPVKKNRVESNICVNNDVINSNYGAICKTCNECLFFGNHDACVVSFLKSSMCSSVKDVLSTKQLGKYGPKQERSSLILVINGGLLEGDSP